MSLGYTRSMRAVMLEVPEALLEDRRRKGLDKKDEVWAGVLHMVPPAASGHNRIARDLLLVLVRIAKRLDAEVLFETGLFDPEQGLKNFRVPDLVVVDAANLSKRGVEGKATLVVEVLSPNDESRDKLPFYAAMGVREVWLIDPTSRAVEVFTLRGARLALVKARGGAFRSPALGVELETVKGKLQIRDGDQIDLV